MSTRGRQTSFHRVRQTLRPGPAGPSPSGREAASQPRAQRCPARHTAPSSGLPAGVSPLKPLPPSAPLPPGSCRPGPWPALRPPAGPSAQQEKKVSTRPGRRPQLPFLQDQLYLLSKRQTDLCLLVYENLKRIYILLLCENHDLCYLCQVSRKCRLKFKKFITVGSL
ncbi:hypothetical protein R6Z07M_013298 [Ovis aries]|nr:translation initiation factor IF-2-like isoform X1 [Ovis aries]